MQKHGRRKHLFANMQQIRNSGKTDNFEECRLIGGAAVRNLSKKKWSGKQHRNFSSELHNLIDSNLVFSKKIRVSSF